MKNKKFTMIELLVVIAISAVIIAMLLPALNKARTRARAVSNAGRLKQVGLACIMYSQDSNELWPPVGAFSAEQLTTKYISAESLSSLNGAAFSLAVSPDADSSPTQSVAVDTSIAGFTNTLYADGHVSTGQGSAVVAGGGGGDGDYGDYSGYTVFENYAVSNVDDMTGCYWTFADGYPVAYSADDPREKITLDISDFTVVDSFNDADLSTIDYSYPPNGALITVCFDATFGLLDITDSASGTPLYSNQNDAALNADALADDSHSDEVVAAFNAMKVVLP